MGLKSSILLQVPRNSQQETRHCEASLVISCRTPGIAGGEACLPQDRSFRSGAPRLLFTFRKGARNSSLVPLSLKAHSHQLSTYLAADPTLYGAHRPDCKHLLTNQYDPRHSSKQVWGEGEGAANHISLFCLKVHTAFCLLKSHRNLPNSGGSLKSLFLKLSVKREYLYLDNKNEGTK